MKLSLPTKKIIFLFFLLTNFLSSHGQNWLPVFPNEIFDYKTDTSKRIEQVIKVDSVNGNVYYLNKIASRCCYDSSNYPIITLNYIINQPVFLQHRIIITDSDFILKGPGTWVVKTHYPLNEQWTYDSANNITAKIISRRPQDRYAQKDSVETILLLPVNDSIVLSKNYGILNFPSGNGHYFIQDGLENEKLGKVRLGFNDYYSFDVGDVFQYSQGNVGPEISSISETKVTIIGKTDLNPGYGYKTRQLWTEVINGPGSTETFHGLDTVDLTYTPASSDSPSYRIYPGEWVNIPYVQYSIGQLSYDSHDNQIGCYVNAFSDFYGNSSSDLPAADTCCSQNDTLPSDVGSETSYSLRKGFGLFENAFGYYYGEDGEGQWKIITGYVKGIDTFNIYPDNFFYAGIKTSSLNKVKWHLSPNPAQNIISIWSSIPVENNFSLELISLAGQIVKNVPLSSNSLGWQISIADVPNGLYVVVVKSKGQIDFRSKIMVTH